MKFRIDPSVLRIVFSVIIVCVCHKVQSLPVGRNGRTECTDFREYFDHGTEHCEQCWEICRHADIMGTQEQCQNSCPRYLKSLACAEKEGMYYDENVDECSQCSQMCDQHYLTKTSDMCMLKCKDYMAKKTPEQVPSSYKQNSLIEVQNGDESSHQKDSTNNWLHPGWIAAISMGSLAILASAVMLLVLYKVCRNPGYVPAPTTEAGALRGGGPVEETNHTLATQLAIAGSPLPAQTAQHQPDTGFSDLGNNGSQVSSDRNPVVI